MPPRIMEPGRLVELSEPNSLRPRCGVIRPTQPMSPVMEMVTVVPTVATTRRMILSRLGFIPPRKLFFFLKTEQVEFPAIAKQYCHTEDDHP